MPLTRCLLFGYIHAEAESDQIHACDTDVMYSYAVTQQKDTRINILNYFLIPVVFL